MNAQYSAKLIQHFLKKNDSHGFILIGLLIIIIIGILAVIALPSLMCSGSGSSRANKIFEAKTYVRSMNRGQQAYFVEYNKLTNSLDALGVGIKPQTTNYNYSTTITNGAAYSYGIARTQDLKSVVGGVFVIPTNKKSEMTTIVVLCLNNKPGTIIPSNPILNNRIPLCSVGTEQIK